MIFKILPGQARCCEGRPSQVNGTYCYPYSSVYTYPNIGSGEYMWNDWNRREFQSQVNRELGFPPGYMGV